MPYMNLDADGIRSLGLRGGSGSVALSSAVVRYTAGVVQRERERLAAIFKDAGLADVAERILDTSRDALVFKWAGPETPLDVPPTPVARERVPATGDEAFASKQGSQG